MSTVFSSSACTQKPSNPQEYCFFRSKKKKATKKDLHQAATAGKGAVLARHNEFLWRQKSNCSFLLFWEKGVVPSIISKFRGNFHKELLGSARQLTDLHGHLSKMEAFHLPGFLLRSSIAQRESDCSGSVQFALIMRQLDRDTTAVTLPGVRRDSLIRIGCIFNWTNVMFIIFLFFAMTALNLVNSYFSESPVVRKRLRRWPGLCVMAVVSKLLKWHSQWVQRWRSEHLNEDLMSSITIKEIRDHMGKIDEPPGSSIQSNVQQGDVASKE